MKLFLDDLRDPPDDTWTVARSYEQAVELIESSDDPLDSISFDHDLGAEKTGKDLANWIVAYDLRCNNLPRAFSWRVHSANPIGAENINKLLSQYIKFINSMNLRFSKTIT